MPMKNPPHPDLSVRSDCLAPLGLEGAARKPGISKHFAERNALESRFDLSLPACTLLGKRKRASSLWRCWLTDQVGTSKSLLAALCLTVCFGSSAALAGNECGAAPDYGGTIHCNESTYTSPPNGDPGIEYKFSYGDFGAYTFELSDLDTNSDTFEIATTANRDHGLDVYQPLGGSISVEMSGGDITAAGNKADGIHLRLDERYYSSGTASVRMTGGSISTKGDRAEGIWVGLKGTRRGQRARDNLSIVLDGGAITTEGMKSYGIKGKQELGGSFEVNVASGTIVTKGFDSHGIYAFRDPRRLSLCRTDPDKYNCNVEVTMSGGSITTGSVETAQDGTQTRTRAESHGIFARQRTGRGNIDITMSGGSIETTSHESAGLHSLHAGSGSVGNARIAVQGGTVTTRGDDSDGILGLQEVDGDIGIAMSGGDLLTEGGSSAGIRGRHNLSGDLDIALSGGTVTTSGLRSHGIFGAHEGTGDLDIAVSSAGKVCDSSSGQDCEDRAGITTEGAHSEAISGRHEGTGDLDIALQGGRVATKGNSSEGIFARHKGTGALDIALQGGSITTEERYAQGIYSIHGNVGDIGIGIADGNITTQGRAADGITAWRYGGDGDITITIVRRERHRDIRLFRGRNYGLSIH